jgi:hypothetical protein
MPDPNIYSGPDTAADLVLKKADSGRMQVVII